MLAPELSLLSNFWAEIRHIYFFAGGPCRDCSTLMAKEDSLNAERDHRNVNTSFSWCAAAERPTVPRGGTDTGWRSAPSKRNSLNFVLLRSFAPPSLGLCLAVILVKLHVQRVDEGRSIGPILLILNGVGRCGVCSPLDLLQNDAPDERKILFQWPWLCTRRRMCVFLSSKWSLRRERKGLRDFAA